MDAFRYRRGDIGPIRVPTKSGRVISIGDLVYLSDGAAQSASQYPWDTDLATTQAGFRAVFIGVATKRQVATDADGYMIVAGTGVFEYPVSGDPINLGDLVGPADGDDTLEPQKLVLVTAANRAIGKVVEKRSSGVIWVSIASVIGTPYGGIGV